MRNHSLAATSKLGHVDSRIHLINTDRSVRPATPLGPLAPAARASLEGGSLVTASALNAEARHHHLSLRLGN
jgi:hypothetical protein